MFSDSLSDRNGYLQDIRVVTLVDFKKQNSMKLFLVKDFTML